MLPAGPGASTGLPLDIPLFDPKVRFLWLFEYGDGYRRGLYASSLVVRRDPLPAVSA